MKINEYEVTREDKILNECKNSKSYTKTKKPGGKHLVAIFVCIALLISGCGTTQPAVYVETEDLTLEDIIPEETITLTVYDQVCEEGGIQSGWFAKVIKDKFNVELEFIPDSDYIFETRMEMGNLGDIIIFDDSNTDYSVAVENNKLFDFEEESMLHTFGTYIEENMQEALEKNRSISGGTIYGIGNNIADSASLTKENAYSWDIRFDLYQQLGTPAISNLDDLLQVLVDMQALEPVDANGNKNYGVSIFDDWDSSMCFFAASLVESYYGYDTFGFGFYDPEDGSYESILDEDGAYIEALKFYNQLNQKGLLNPNAMVLGYEGTESDYMNGRCYFSLFDWFGSGIYNTEENLEQGKAMLSVVPEEAEIRCENENPYGENQIWAIGNTSNYPELSMAILNWLSTPEGSMTMTYGPQGVIWDYDQEGNTYFTDLGIQCINDQTTPMPEEYTGTYQDGLSRFNNTIWDINTINPESNGETYNSTSWKLLKENQTAQEDTSESTYEIITKWQAFSQYESTEEYLMSNYHQANIGSTFKETALSDELVITWNQIANCVNTYSWNAIYAKTDQEFNSIISEMIEQAEAYGYQKCYDAMLAEVELRKTAEANVVINE